MHRNQQRVNTMTLAARIIGFFALLLLIALPVRAATDAEFERLMELSGTTRQVEEFQRGVRLGLEQGASQGDGLPAEALKQMLAGVDEHIRADVILDEIRFAVLKRMSREDVSRLLQWYESPLGQRITQAEIAAARPDSMEQMMAKADELLAMEERVAWAQRLDKLIGGTEMNMAIQQDTGAAVYRALIRTQRPDEPVDLAPYNEQMAVVQPRLRDMMENLVILNIVHTYRDFDMETLTRYEAFLNEPLSVMFNKAVGNGMQTGIARVVDAWIIDIIEDASGETVVKG